MKLRQEGTESLPGGGVQANRPYRGWAESVGDGGCGRTRWGHSRERVLVGGNQKFGKRGAESARTYQPGTARVDRRQGGQWLQTGERNPRRAHTSRAAGAEGGRGHTPSAVSAAHSAPSPSSLAPSPSSPWPMLPTPTPPTLSQTAHTTPLTNCPGRTCPAKVQRRRRRRRRT